MAEISLLFKKTRVTIGAVTLDASLSEQHSSENEITEHPVERGANIVDHSRVKPITLTIEGLISNSPIQDPSVALVPRSSEGVSFSSRSIDQPERAGQALRDLTRIKDTAELITVVTSIRSYDNMLIRSLSVPRDSRVGQALRFSATLIEVRFASTRTVNLEAKGKPKNSGGKKTGAQTPQPVVDRSLLKGATDALGFTVPGSGI